MKSVLYLAVRTDIGEGRRAAMLVHATAEWVDLFGPHRSTVVVYRVPDEASLLEAAPAEGRTALWREPDFNNEAAAFATDVGPMHLPLLGSSRKKSPRALRREAFLGA